ncbi:hypothetical protein AO392_14125 [Pseudomonas putida]|nr:hypothetical protein AO392_14125 [Pseudomonas putida]
MPSTSTSSAPLCTSCCAALSTVTVACQRSSQLPMFSASSSTGARTYTCTPPRSMPGSAGNGVSGSTNGRRSVKLLPNPCSLTTFTSPPINALKRLQIDRPSPVPLTRLLARAW